MASFWMLDSARNTIGPFEDEKIRQLASNGTLKAEDLICGTDGGGWVPASAVRPGYFQVSSAPPPPPPTTPYAPQQVASQQSSDAGDAVVGLLIPWKVNPVALIAGYAGIFSILLFPGPIALILGLVARYQLKSRPSDRGAGRAWFAIIAGALGTIGLFVFVLNGSLTRW